MKFELNIHPRILLSYKRMPYKAWYALAEFIDNSTQSWLDNRFSLSPNGEPIEIDITLDQSLIRVADTAMGMDQEDLDRALQLARPPDDISGRSEFGLGMKTAACWFGDLWRVKTTKLGVPHEYEVEVDVQRVAEGNLQLKTVEREKSPEDHYTIIEIEQLHRPVHHKSRTRLKDHIRSIYRVDIREADLWVRFDGEDHLDPWEIGDEFLKAVDGTPYRRMFEYILNNGKKVHGWLGVLARGSGGRGKAGIATIRRGRVIQGQPNAWKPMDIYGDRRNDLLNQRLVGEINLDDFGVSHTKDDIQWEGGEEEEIIEFFRENFSEYFKVARRTYKDIEGERTDISEAEKDLGFEEMRTILESPEFEQMVDLEEVPPKELIDASADSMRESARALEPDRIFHVGEKAVKVFLNDTLSPMDHYFLPDWPEGDLLVNINKNHSHWKRMVKDPDSFMIYVLDCVFDALAEWKAARRTAQIDHETFRYIKDTYLRHNFEVFGTDSESGAPP